MNFSNWRRFKIGRYLGRRLCFSLYEALDRKLDRLVFLKLVDNQLVSQTPKRFVDTCELIRSLNGQHTYKIYEYGLVSGHLYIVSEVSYARSLSKILEEDPALSVEKLAEIFVCVSRALRTAHLKGIVHGLLNPNCIFIEPDGVAKVDDFGLYWLSPYLSDEEFHAIREYVAPEVLERVEEVDGRADIYSVGALLSELATDLLPNPIFSAGAENLQLASERLQVIVPKCLHENPNLRYLTVREVFEELRLLNGDEA